MDANQRFAVEFVKQALNSKEVLMSNAFFKPFFTKHAREVCHELLKAGFMVLEYPGNKKGALIVRREKCIVLEGENCSGWLFTANDGNMIAAKQHEFAE